MLKVFETLVSLATKAATSKANDGDKKSKLSVWKRVSLIIKIYE